MVLISPLCLWKAPHSLEIWVLFLMLSLCKVTKTVRRFKNICVSCGKKTLTSDILSYAGLLLVLSVKLKGYKAAFSFAARILKFHETLKWYCPKSILKLLNHVHKSFKTNIWFNIFEALNHSIMYLSIYCQNDDVYSQHTEKQMDSWEVDFAAAVVWKVFVDILTLWKVILWTFLYIYWW